MEIKSIFEKEPLEYVSYAFGKENSLKTVGFGLRGSVVSFDVRICFFSCKKIN